MKNTAARLSKLIGQQYVQDDLLSRTAHGADAGCYSKTPKLVLQPRSEEEVQQILGILHAEKVPLTFRAAGTSLSGQAISDSVLLVARGEHWKNYEILDEGKRIRTAPGITGTRLNQVLAPTGMKFGPDPASINSAMVGGIIANNASGMSCGVHANAYATIESARILFADGYLLDTADKDADHKLQKDKPELYATLLRIRDALRSNKQMSARIRKKYAIKNTTGYGMNSFLDHDSALGILLHLMVGSEGTLGFVSEATFRTVPIKAYRASSLIYFRDLDEACNAVPGLREAGVPAIEIMDRKALRAVEMNAGVPSYIREFPEQVSALLIDLEAESETELEELITRSRKKLENFKLVHEFQITRNPAEIAGYWNVRKGVFPAVGGMRKPGTSVIIEDIAVRAEHLSATVKDLRKMLDDLGYEEAVIYGHVLDGNLHFIFAQDFQDKAEVEKYRLMIDELVRLIVDKYDGSLKAEHGTGLNMAPFVEKEWGSEIHGYMKEIKEVFDPAGILNPGVIINEDAEAHLKGFKPMPVIDEAVDACIECGFCEINCLTNGLTLSARQRIVVQRDIENRSGREAKELARSFAYPGEASCAGDGLCATSCPLDIDTGVMVKHLRERNHLRRMPGNPIATWLSKNFRLIHFFLRSGLGLATFGHRLLRFQKIWVWDTSMPRPARRKVNREPGSGAGSPRKIVYFPSCINQSMGPAVSSRENTPLAEVIVDVLRKAGYQVIFPKQMDKMCCGTPWESKGFFDIADAKTSELEDALREASENGKYPILCDTSPCTHRMRRKMGSDLKLYEPVEFIHDFLLGEVELEKQAGPLAFHVTCTSVKMGLEEKFRTVANACTDQAIFPEEVGCCGFAGDKGFFQPEINSWALRNLKLQVDRTGAGYSNSRTCEIGLTRNSGIDYNSVFYLLRDCMK